MKDKAFTLIELLVVVLIIGILAAIAVPQYTLAVNKARFANLRMMASSLVKAAEAYRLANNEYPSNFDDIALDLPGGFTMTTTTDASCGSTSEIYCCIVPKKSGAWAAAVSCGRKDYSFAIHRMLQPNSTYCVADQNNADAVRLCQSFGSHDIAWTAIPTPNGIKSNHPYYEIKQ